MIFIKITRSVVFCLYLPCSRRTVVNSIRFTFHVISINKEKKLRFVFVIRGSYEYLNTLANWQRKAIFPFWKNLLKIVFSFTSARILKIGINVSRNVILSFIRTFRTLKILFPSKKTLKSPTTRIYRCHKNNPIMGLQRPMSGTGT